MTTYAQLQTDVADFAARENLSAKVPNFIKLAESKIAREIRVIEMQKTTTLSVPDTGTIALPTRFLGFRSVSYANVPALSGSARLDYLTPDRFNEMQVDSNQISGIVCDGYYTTEGSNFLLLPKPGSGETTDIKIGYWERFELLSDTNTTNWLLTEHFDIYLAAVMHILCKYIKDFDEAAFWKSEFNDAKVEIHRSERRKARSGPHQRTAPDTP